MAGHMQHGPYPLQEVISDIWWLACGTATLILSVRMRARGRLLFLIGSLLLTLGWIFAGGDLVFSLPLLGAMNVYAIGYLVLPSKFEPGGEPPPA